MNTSNIVKKLSVVTASAALLLMSSSAVHAASFSLAKSSGKWISVTGGSNINGLDTKKVSWGNPKPSGDQSGLKFEGVDAMDFGVDEIFKVGTLTHFNHPITDAALEADLKIKLKFDNPNIKPFFNFSFAIDETRNSSPCAHPSKIACSDLISFPSSLPSESFAFMGKYFTLELLGFGQDPENFEPEFITQEKKNNKTHLFARITENEPLVQDVPEPASLLGLLAIGALGASSFKGKKIAN